MTAILEELKRRKLTLLLSAFVVGLVTVSGCAGGGGGRIDGDDNDNDDRDDNDDGATGRIEGEGESPGYGAVGALAALGLGGAYLAYRRK